MAIVKTRGEQDTGVARVSEGQLAEVRSTRDGALFRCDWKQAMVMEGRGFMINIGAVTAPVIGGGVDGKGVDNGAPEFVIGVPTGTSILPIHVEIKLGLPVGATDADEVEITLAVDQDKLNAQSSGTAGTAPIIYNMNTKHNRASNCWANQQYSATMTAPVLDLILANAYKVFQYHGTSTNSQCNWQGFELLYEPETPVIINGPAMFIGYYGGTAAASGYAVVQWLELPTSNF